MIVIQQTPIKGALPQPPGHSTASVKRDEMGSSTVKSEATNVVNSRSRTFARSASMLQTQGSQTMHSLHTSRSTSPLTSTASSIASSSMAADAVTSTPASTCVSLTSTPGSRSRPRRAAAQAKESSNADVVNQSTQNNAKRVSCEDPAAILYDVPKDVIMPSFARPSANAQRDLARVWEAVGSARRIAVICGAGISVSSPANIPDFRSAQGLFRKLKEKHPNVGLQSGKDLFDASLFNSSTTSACFYSMISELKAMADAAAPTTFHHLLKRLDMEGRLMRVYTQNIDGLEEKAGLTFGLGEAGDSRSTLRALGKRKRQLADAQRKAGTSFARSKSEPAITFGRGKDAADDARLSEPMFPRAIPLHGSLSTMTCQVCGHKIYLDLAASGPPRPVPRGRELSPDASDQAMHALDMLSQGEPVACKHCESAEQVRAVAGLRSRGIGMMKVDVVLYNGQNDGAERVGDCVERDILGLRDPNEPGVPENNRERLLRERKERKDEAKGAAATAAAKTEDDEARAAKASITTAPASADDAFAAAFFEDEDAADTKMAEQELLFGSQSALPAMPTSQAKPKRQVRLKPLPPDLLIVAGTSLKVPGTKRLVREFAKACQAHDYCEYDSSDDEDGKDKASRGSTPRETRSQKSKNVDAPKDEEEDEENDVNAPIRTILLNYDFPLPPTQWEDVFDVWVQGDVQQAALGLWDSTKYPEDQVANDFHMATHELHDVQRDGLCWSSLQGSLEEERKKVAKKASAKKPSASQQGAESVPCSQSSKATGRALSRTKSQPTTTVKKAASASAKTATGAKSKAKAKPIASSQSSASPTKKKAKKTDKTSANNVQPPPVNAGLTKFMKGSTKASFARVNSAPASTTKAKKAAA